MYPLRLSTAGHWSRLVHKQARGAHYSSARPGRIIPAHRCAPIPLIRQRPNEVA